MNPVTKAGEAGTRARLVLILSLLALGIYFTVSSYDGLNAYFTLDDGGNLLHMHKYWENSLWDVIGSALLVVTRAYRPLGGIYYFVLYKLAGFSPVPFRAVCLVLMLANVYLAFSLLRLLSGSFEAALLGAVAFAHHPAMLYLLYSSGTIYEILCFLFYFLAVRCYFVWRQAAETAGRHTLSWRQLAVLVVLTGCALDSKEMAMTLPAALLLVEIVYFPPASWSWREAGRVVLQQGRGALATAALVIPTIAVKVFTRNPLSDDPAYAEHSLHATLVSLRAFQNALLYRHLYIVSLSTRQLIALWAAMAVVAFVLRSRPMKFGLCFLVLSLVPVVLITRRVGYMLYIPLMGWVLYGGALFHRLSSGAVHLTRLRPRIATPARVALFAGVAGLIIHANGAQIEDWAVPVRRGQSELRHVVESLRKAYPTLPRGASLLMRSDPLPIGYDVMFLTQVAYGDPTLVVDRNKMLDVPPCPDVLAHYTRVFGGGTELRDVSGQPDTRPAVEVRFLPAVVRPGDSYTVEIPGFAGQALDVAVGTAAGDRKDRAVVHNWCTLDAAGRATLVAPASLTQETIRVRWLRSRGGEWMPATGVLDIGL